MASIGLTDEQRARWILLFLLVCSKGAAGGEFSAIQNSDPDLVALSVSSPIYNGLEIEWGYSVWAVPALSPGCHFADWRIEVRDHVSGVVINVTDFGCPYEAAVSADGGVCSLRGLPNERQTTYRISVQEVCGPEPPTVTTTTSGNNTITTTSTNTSTSVTSTSTSTNTTTTTTHEACTPVFLGCFQDNDDRDLCCGPRKFGYFTPGACYEECRQFKYFALQASSWCSCDNSYGTPRSIYKELREDYCYDENNQLMGGTWTNAVYQCIVGYRFWANLTDNSTTTSWVWDNETKLMINTTATTRTTTSTTSTNATVFMNASGTTTGPYIRKATTLYVTTRPRPADSAAGFTYESELYAAAVDWKLSKSWDCEFWAWRVEHREVRSPPGEWIENTHCSGLVLHSEWVRVYPEEDEVPYPPLRPNCTLREESDNFTNTTPNGTEVLPWNVSVDPEDCVYEIPKEYARPGWNNESRCTSNCTWSNDSINGSATSVTTTLSAPPKPGVLILVHSYLPGLRFNTSNCRIPLLDSNTAYEIRVTERCYNPLANSAPANANFYTQVRPAEPPTNLEFDVDFRWVSLNWVQAWLPFDCQFVEWTVEYRTTNKSAWPQHGWRVAHECSVFQYPALAELATTTTINTTSTTNTTTTTSSSTSSTSSSTSTTMNGTNISELHVVDARRLASHASQSVWDLNYTMLKNQRNDSFCNVTLPSNVEYTFRVRESCTDSRANSPFAYWPKIMTLHNVASAPTDLKLLARGFTWLHITWTPGAAGDCHFKGWRVESYALKLGVQKLIYHAQCFGQGVRKSSCNVTGLHRSTEYIFQVREICTDYWVNSIPSVASHPFLTAFVRASAPSALHIHEVGYDWIQFKWDSGIAPADCAFEAWRVEFRDKPEMAEQSNSTWIDFSIPISDLVQLDDVNSTNKTEFSSALFHFGCSRTRHYTTCNVSSLSTNVHYEIRVQEACVDSWTNSDYAYNELPWWTLPAEWIVNVGASANPTIHVDALAPVDRCIPRSTCTGCPDQFSVCHSGVMGQSVAVTRIDLPTGWTQPFELRCVAFALRGFAINPDVAASTPALKLTDPTWGTLYSQWQLTSPGTCMCVGMQFQWRSADHSSWSARPEASCNDLMSRSCIVGRKDSVFDLAHDTHYEARLRLTCNGSYLQHAPGFLNSDWAYASNVTTKVLQADPPTNFTLYDVQNESMSFWWLPGKEPRDCVFAAWLVEYRRKHSSDGTWTNVSECSGAGYRNLTSCTLYNLSFNAEYEIRVKETCDDFWLDPPHARSSSEWGLIPFPFWTLPGEFFVAVGESPWIPYKTTQLGQPILECSIIKEHSETDDSWSKCYNGPPKTEITLTRTDVPSGWAQNLVMRCTAFCMTPFIQITPPEPVLLPPALLELRDPQVESLLIRYQAGIPGDSCECAKTEFQLKAKGYTDWYTVAGLCDSVLGTSCLAEGLLPNVQYLGRIRMTCKDDTLNSPWKYAIPADTLPPCKWLNSSGRQHDFECDVEFNETFCRDHSEALNNDTCCDAQGGRLRCPDSDPVLCELSTFPGGPRACVASRSDCAPYGGPRPCSYLDVPAPTPQFVSGLSIVAQVITLIWSHGSYIVHQSLCTHKYWYVELSERSSGPWYFVDECHFADVSQTTCFITAMPSPGRPRLGAILPYYARVRQVCNEWHRNSNWMYTPALITGPWPAIAPSQAQCEAPGATTVTTSTTTSTNTTFTSNTSTTTTSTSTSTFTSTTMNCSNCSLDFNGSYSPISTVAPTSITSSAAPISTTNCSNCSGTNISDARIYGKRNATNSYNATNMWGNMTDAAVYASTTSITTTTRTTTEDYLSSVRFYHSGTSLFVSWVAENPENCTFLSWEVQAKLIMRQSRVNAYGTFEVWDHGSEWFIGCFSYKREKTHCLIPGLLSNRSYRVRVRETCSNFKAAFSKWTQLSKDCHVPAVSSFPPENISTFGIQLYQFGVQWDAADTRACILLGWAVQARINGTSWDLPPEERGPGAYKGTPGSFECLTPPNVTECIMDVGLGSDRWYDVRVRPVCTDMSFSSPWVVSELAAQTLVPIPAGSPSNISFFPLPPSQLRVTWLPDASGDCKFQFWVVELSLSSDRPPIWREQLECRTAPSGLLPREALFDDSGSKVGGCLITIATLQGNTVYDIRVREQCTDLNANSEFYEVPEAIQMRYLAGTPENISIQAPGYEWMKLKWDASPQQGECQFRYWNIEYREEILGSRWSMNLNAWLQFRGCDGMFNRVTPTCNITGLKQNTAYEVRIQEICADPWTKSSYNYTFFPMWTLPGDWVVRVGPSSTLVASVDVLTPPQRCYVHGVGVMEQFSFCYTGYFGQQVALTRVDINGGWGNDLYIQCRGLSLEHFTAPPEEVAVAPERLQLFPEDLYSFLSWQTYSKSIGSCSCAEPELTYRADGTDEWFRSLGKCADVSSRQCTVSNLVPDTRYWTRIRLICTDRPQQLTTPVPHHSDYTYGDTPVDTRPPCKWSRNSGFVDILECWDGHYCNVQNTTCCDDHGGVLRCPKNIPELCNNRSSCSHEQDDGLPCGSSCRSDCSDAGGVKTCSLDQVPQQSPKVTFAGSLQPATLNIEWESGLYFYGRAPACTFLRWEIEVAHHNDQRFVSCEQCALDQFYTVSCAVTQPRAYWGTYYDIRLREICEDPTLFSDWTLVTLTPRPWPATIPISVACYNFTHQSFEASWQAPNQGLPSSTGNCTFLEWKVERKRLARQEWFDEHGKYTPFMPAGDWAFGCIEKNRSVTKCSISGLLSQHRYDFRVREVCVDPQANSDWKTLTSIFDWYNCPTQIGVPAQMPTELNITEVDIYSFELRWYAGEPNDCIFEEWQVETKLLQQSWDAGTSFSCSSTLRNATDYNYCTVFVGVGSDAFYDVRVRERCTDPLLYSSWAYNSIPAKTKSPTAAEEPSGLSLVATASSRVTMNWAVGSSGDCVFASWRVEMAVSNVVPKAWAVMSDCLSLPRTATTCYITGLLSEHRYDARISETCTDANANSVVTTVSEAVLMPPRKPATAPLSTVPDTSKTPFSFDLLWIPGDAHDCDFSSWDVQIRLPGQAWSGPLLECGSLPERNNNSCRIGNLLSNTLYNLQVRETCEDPAMNSFYDAVSATTLPAPAGKPHQLVSLPTTSSFHLGWQAGVTGDCTFQSWGVYYRFRGKSLPGDTSSGWIGPVSGCSSPRAGVSCQITGLTSDTYYDLRVQERCSDADLNSPIEFMLLQRTSPIPATAPVLFAISNITQTGFDLAWDAGSPEECIFEKWVAEVRPSVLSMWLPMPECSSGNRDTRNCTVVGLHSSMDYKVRVSEHCTDELANSAFGTLTVRTTEGALIDVGESSAMSKVIQQTGMLNSCVYRDKCCSDEFSVCFVTQSLEITRVDKQSGWAQKMSLSCIADNTHPSLLKRFMAKEPLAVNVSQVTDNSLAIHWSTPSAYSSAYLSDCACPSWRVEIRRSAAMQWVPALGCNNVDFGLRTCLVMEFEENFLLPLTLYDIRLQQACSNPRLSSEFVTVSGKTLPGCDWSTHSGRDDEAECNDGFFCNITVAPDCCSVHGGRKRCPRQEPYMCNQRGLSCGNDFCCSETPCSGGLRPCRIALAAWSPLSGAIDIIWGKGVSDGYSPRSVCTSLAAWKVNITDVTFGSEFNISACEPVKPSLDGFQCRLAGLRTKAWFLVEVQEECADGTMPRDAATTYVYTRPERAGIPMNLRITDHTETRLTIVVDSNPKRGECIHVSWQADYRPASLADEPWTTSVGSCTVSGDSAVCTLPGLVKNSPYDVRVKESCLEPEADSPYVVSQHAFWTKPSSWMTQIGPSFFSFRKVVTLSHLPQRCRVYSAVPGDTFSVCLDGTGSVNVERTDTPLGWSQNPGLSCWPSSMNHLIQEDLSQATDPLSLLLLYANRQSLTATYSFGEVGDCSCPKPRMQLRTVPVSSNLGRVTSMGDWFIASAGECLDMSLRECAIVGLQPDTIYEGRVQIACTEAELDSNFTYAVASATTLPGCFWSTHSGSPYTFRCADFTSCNSTDSSCCRDHGGILQCSPEAPVMCANANDCDGGRDHCCMIHCVGHGGPRTCSDSEVPTKQPLLLTFLSESPRSLTVTWQPGQYFSGFASSCMFSYWLVEFAPVYSWGQGSWVQACINYVHSDQSCVATNLQRVTKYSVRVQEVCQNIAPSSVALNSHPVIPDVLVETWPVAASAPVAIIVDTSDDSILSLSWQPGADLGDCMFTHYSAEYRDVEVGIWISNASCAQATSPNCTDSGLQWNRIYEVRVMQRCTDPRANSDFLYTRKFRPLGPDRKDVYVGPSQSNEILSIDLMSSPDKCVVSGAGIGVDFQLCYNGQFASLMRTDRIFPVGWNDAVWLRCSPTAAFIDTPAAQPLSLKFQFPDRHSLLASYTFGAMGTCACAAPHLQIRAEDENNWTSVGGDCADMSRRQCWVQNLLPNTRYYGRLQVSCSDANQMSAWKEIGSNPIVTLPACKWSVDSGRHDEFECVDGSFCSIANATCCDIAGGLLRCPRNLPILCARANTCASDCSMYDGPRPCTSEDVPAPVPVFIEATSIIANRLTLEWAPGDYVLSRSSACDFHKWSVQLARIHHWGQDGWTSVPLCESTAYAAPKCDISGLVGHGWYAVRVSEVCTNHNLNSDYAYVPTVGIWPVSAEMPSLVNCSDVTDTSLEISWIAGQQNNCEFVGFQVEIQHVPNPSSYEWPAPTGSWVGVCTARHRSIANCSAYGLLSGRFYMARIRELCVDERANSLFASFETSCRTTVLPAEPPWISIPSTDHAGGLAVLPYEFLVQWMPGDPKACIFKQWEVQAQLAATVDWSVLAQAYTCGNNSLNGRWCWVQVGLHSNTEFRVRLRRSCTSPELNSPWVETGLTTLSPQRANPPQSASFSMLEPGALRVSFTPGLSNQCVFSHWLIQITPQSAGQYVFGVNVVTQTIVQTRSLTECDISIASVPENINHVIELSEVCTDPNANSLVNKLWGTYIYLRPPPIGPFLLQFIGALDTSLDMTWFEGQHSQTCAMQKWDVEIRALGSSSWQEVSDCSGLAWVEDSVVSNFLNESVASITTSTTSTLANGFTRCVAGGLAPATGYDVQIIGACLNPTSKSVSFSSELPFWTRPGTWTTYVGDSNAVTKMVDIQHRYFRCEVVKECCHGNQFSICHSGPDGRYVTVMRTDSVGGWGQILNLRCFALSYNNFIDVIEKPAADPSLLRLIEPSPTSLVATFALGDDIGTCECATLILEIRQEHSEWEYVGGDCTTMAAYAFGRRQCLVSGLEAATVYYGRIRIKCSNDAASSNFTESAPVRTMDTIPIVTGTIVMKRLSNESSNETSIIASTPNGDGNESHSIAGFENGPAVMRRLSSAAVSTAVNLLADLAQVQPSSVFISVVDARIATLNANEFSSGIVDEEDVLLRYNLAHESVEGAKIVADKLNNNEDGAWSQVIAVFGLDDEMNVVPLTPQVEIRKELFQACGLPPMVTYASSDWDPHECAGRTWSHLACSVLCSPGFRVEGSFTCSAMGEWIGEPQCIPEWTADSWSSCSSSCGAGVQQRTVQCAVEGGCSGEPMSSQQDCWGAVGCAWVAAAWDNCLPACGNSSKHRSIACSSGRNDDCSGIAPPNTTACEDYSTCYWQTSNWGACSNTCGFGTQVRSVTCPSTVISHCRDLAAPPETVRFCTDKSNCQWQSSEWSQCSSSCGAGQVHRDVTCPSGVEADCTGTQPSTTEPCFSTDACDWVLGAWSTCSSSCGSGLQVRSVSCPTGEPSDCSTAMPAASQACYETFGCAWSLSDWGICSSECGFGIQSRVASCTTGVDADCSHLQHPGTEQVCYSVRRCVWQVGAWSSCSESCGSGTRSRVVSCPAGTPAACGNSMPISSETCRNTSQCEWHTSAWSECSNTCGNGTLSRTVFCPSGDDSDCGNSKPSSSVNCRDTSGCGWSITPWSSCSVDCGAGTQSRTRSCLIAGSCPMPGPSTSQACYATGNCAWSVSSWSPCSSQCGPGLNSRTVVCPSLSDVDCPGTKPDAEQSCWGTDCMWYMSEWSRCNNSCGNGSRTRSVLCPSGNPSDCNGARPEDSERCRNTTGCSWHVGEWSSCSATCGPGVSTRDVRCSSSYTSDCAAHDRPSASNPCYAIDTCVWQVGAWSLCDTGCGQGLKTRNAWCSSGKTSDCVGNPPATQLTCRDFSRCSWVSSEWSQCSDPCGPGYQNRTVHCMDIDDVFCAHIVKPLDRQVCDGRDNGCAWDASAWSDCSAMSCGSIGTRSRTVACPSSRGDSDCWDIRPTTIESCMSIVACTWRTFPWSTCEVECGTSLQFRNVSCPTGSDNDCPGEKPNISKSCHSDDACGGWSVGQWSPCNSTCGLGAQTRTVSCSNGNCIGAGPISNQSCYDTSMCSWTVGQWSVCDATCGDGLQTRSVSCLSGVEEDCSPAFRPADQQYCWGSQCAWIVSAWTLCSNTCGIGVQKRTVTCSSGIDADCIVDHDRPQSSQTCKETGGCMWQSSSWSECPPCGGGNQTRHVWCPSSQVEDCEGDMPANTRTCIRLDGCNWTLSSWSGCSVSCGQGVQTRNVSCVFGMHCQGLAPASSQICLESFGCQWMVAEWSACSSSCGIGSRSRDVTCKVSGGCGGERPLEVLSCFSNQSCQWYVSGWSPCDSTCNVRTRQAFCPSGNDLDCPKTLPSLSRVCDMPSCTALQNDVSLSFNLTLVLEESASDSSVQTLLAIVQKGVARSLSIPESFVRVRLFSSSSYFGTNRRLAPALSIEVTIDYVTNGIVQFLGSNKSDNILASSIRDELVSSGFSEGNFNVLVNTPMTATVDTASVPLDDSHAQPSMGPKYPGSVANNNHTPNNIASIETADGGGSVAGAMIGVLGALLFGSLIVGCVVWYRRGRGDRRFEQMDSNWKVVDVSKKVSETTVESLDQVLIDGRCWMDKFLNWFACTLAPNNAPTAKKLEEVSVKQDKVAGWAEQKTQSSMWARQSADENQQSSIWTRLRASCTSSTTTTASPLSPIGAMPKTFEEQEETPPDDKHGPQAHVRQSPDAQRLRLAGRFDDVGNATLADLQDDSHMPRCQILRESASAHEMGSTLAASGTCSTPSSPLPLQERRPSASGAAIPNLVPDKELRSSLDTNQTTMSESPSLPTCNASRFIASRIRHIRGSTPPPLASPLSRQPTPQCDPALVNSSTLSVHSGQSGHSIVEVSTPTSSQPRPKRYLE